MTNHVPSFDEPNSQADFADDLVMRLRRMEASQRVTEMLMTQVFLRFAHSTGDMRYFVNVVLDNMELDIQRAVTKADPRHQEAALDVVDNFEDLKRRTLAMMPKNAAVN